MGGLTRALAVGVGAAAASLRRSAHRAWEPAVDTSTAEILFIAGAVGGKLAAAIAEARTAFPPDVPTLWLRERDEELDGALAARLSSLGPLRTVVVPDRIDRLSDLLVRAEDLQASVAHGPLPDPVRTVELDGQSDLATEDLVVSFGPVHPALATPLRLVLALDGEQIRDVAVDPAYAKPRRDADRVGDRLDPDAPATATLVAELVGGGAGDLRPLIAAAELERAAHHLRAVARHLWLLGLPERAVEVSSLAAMAADGPARDLPTRIAHLARARWLSSALLLRARHVGVISPERARGSSSGVIARASGVETDARADGTLRDAYTSLGFTTSSGTQGDDAERLRLRLREAVQALSLAEAARTHDRPLAPAEQADAIVVETPRGRLTVGRDGRTDPPSRRHLDLAADLLIGARYADVALIIDGLDVSAEEVELAA